MSFCFTDIVATWPSLNKQNIRCQVSSKHVRNASIEIGSSSGRLTVNCLPSDMKILCQKKGEASKVLISIYCQLQSRLSWPARFTMEFKFPESLKALRSSLNLCAYVYTIKINCFSLGLVSSLSNVCEIVERFSPIVLRWEMFHPIINMI